MALLAALLLWAPGSASAEVVHGVRLPDGAEKVGENRYRVRDSFEGTMKHFRSAHPAGSFPRKSIVNQPSVKAVHVENPKGNRFLGFNVYEANGEVRIFIIPAPAPARKAPPARRPGR